MTYKDGSVYKGSLNDDERHGDNGDFTVGNKVFKGSFVHDKMNGVFYVSENDKTEKIEYEMGLRIKKSVVKPIKEDSKRQSLKKGPSGTNN